MANELSRLKSILYGFGVERINEHSSTAMASGGIQINVNAANRLKLSQSLFDAAAKVFVTYDKAEDGKYGTVYEPLLKLREYDITAHLVSNSDEFEKILRSRVFIFNSESNPIIHLRLSSKL